MGMGFNEANPLTSERSYVCRNVSIICQTDSGWSRISFCLSTIVYFMYFCLMDRTTSTKTANPRIILIILFFGVLMGALDISIVGPAMPSISKSFRVDEGGMAWIFSIYVLFNLVGISFLSRLSDIHGRRILYVISIFVFALGSLIAAFSPNLNVLLIGRAVQGFGASGIFPVASAVVGDIFPPEKRGRALGMIGAVFGIAFIVGPIIAGLILMFTSWHALFLINLPIAVILMLFAWIYLPGRIKNQDRSFDFYGAVLMGLSLACFALAVNMIRPDDLLDSLSSALFLGLFFGCILFFALFYRVELRTKDPVLKVEIFKTRQLRVLGLIAIGLGLFQSVFVFIPQMSVHLFSISISEASFMLMPLVIATAIASPLAGRFTDRFGSRIVIAVGLFIAGMACAFLAFSGQNHGVFYTAGALLGIGFSFRSSLNYIMLNEVPPSERASTQGILAVLVSVGQLSGAAAIGALLSSEKGPVDGFKYTFLYLFALAVALTLLSLFLKSRKSERGDLYTEV